jgi:hypothetical protein
MHECASVRDEHQAALLLGSAEGHEYPDLQVVDKVNSSTFFVLTIASFNNKVVFFGTLATGRDTYIWLGCDNSGKSNAGFQPEDQGELGNEDSMNSEFPKTGRAARNIPIP